VTWGTMLYWAQNNSSLFTGAWWDVFTPATIIAVFGGALALINMSIDQVSNPKLKTGPHLKLWKSLSQKLETQRSPK
jgi:peptide/nickel transport system permease protein